jgi:GNAT superfamily N-acetyltransferase
MRIREIGAPGDLGWIVQAHGEIYAAEYAWNSEFEGLVARIVADFAALPDDARADGWIAELDDRRVGCVLCIPADEDTAQLRILLVDPSARGHGLGGQLVDRCIEFARAAGYRRMRLWTNDPLIDARRIYLARGYALIEEEKHHSYGHDLVGQVYELVLDPFS